MDSQFVTFAIRYKHKKQRELHHAAGSCERSESYLTTIAWAMHDDVSEISNLDVSANSKFGVAPMV